MPEPRNVQLDPERERDYPAAFWLGRHQRFCLPLMLIGNHARYLGVNLGPYVADYRWIKARNKFVGICARIRSSSQSLIERLVSFKIFELSVLEYVGSVAQPDKAIIAIENIALLRVSAGLRSFISAEKYLRPKS